MSAFPIPVRTIINRSHWLLSLITITETMVSGKRGINPVNITTLPKNKLSESGIELASTPFSQFVHATDCATRALQAAMEEPWLCL